MKSSRIRILIAAAILATGTSTVFAAAYSGSGAGSSTIGPDVGDDYPTLAAAVAAIHAAHPAGGRNDGTTWTFFINGDITEPAHFGLAVDNSNGSLIVFKPSPTLTPTITITQATDNAGISGSILIGTRSLTSSAIADSLPTSGIVIDGSNTVGGTTRDLTITNTGTGFNFSSLIAITHAANNVQVLNTNLIQTHVGVSGSTINAISIRPRYETGLEAIPTDILIENCTLTSTASPQGVALNIASNGTVGTNTGAPGPIVRGCDINGRIRGMFFNPARGYTVEDNTITVTGNSGFDTFGVYNFNSIASAATPYTSVVRNNRIKVSNPTAAANVQGPTGIFLGTMGNDFANIAEVYNNQVVVENTGARDAGVNANIRGIAMTSGITWRVYHNTVFIPDNAATANTVTGAASYGIGGWAVGSYNADVRNNIVVVEEANIPCISVNTAPSGAAGTGLISNYNLLFPEATALTGRLVAATAATLADWRTLNSTDAQSDSFDPRPDFTDVTVATADLTLTAAARNAVEWGAPALAAVTDDFEGDVRAAVAYRGFDELADALAAPDVTLTPDDVDEDATVGTVVGNLATDDSDTAQSYVYSIVAGVGDTHNNLFAIANVDEVQVDAALDYGVLGANLTIRVETSDGGLPDGLSFEQAIPITLNEVTTVNEWMILHD